MDLLRGAVFGTLLPFGLAAVSEVRACVQAARARERCSAVQRIPLRNSPHLCHTLSGWSPTISSCHCCCCLLLPLQATQRATFLRDCKRPMTTLGPFWGRVNLVVRRFQRQPAASSRGG